jgi:hypothetical protein
MKEEKGQERMLDLKSNSVQNHAEIIKTIVSCQKVPKFLLFVTLRVLIRVHGDDK